MKFYVIGIDDNNNQHFTDDIKEVISNNTVFSGGIRHKNIVKNKLPDNHIWIDITTPLINVFDKYKKYHNIVIFASGDPLFYGFANTIQQKIPEAKIILYPNFNSIQKLSHRTLLANHDIYIVSLTGRPWDKFDEALIIGYEKIGILTDNKEHTPNTIAERMLCYGYTNYKMIVGELLGNKDYEKIAEYDIQNAVNKKFYSPNCIILIRTNQRNRPFGIPENEFHLLNNRDKMITKMPIRLLSLNALDLRNKKVFWDIGFCTGSVSIEAKLQFPHLQIIAFEKRKQAEELIRKNTRKFGTPGIIYVIDDFTEIDLTKYPKPDAVFIGGHGGQMDSIINKITQVLNKNGTVVFNSVSAVSRNLFINNIKKYNLEISNSISITIDNFNTIEVLKAQYNKAI